MNDIFEIMTSFQDVFNSPGFSLFVKVTLIYLAVFWIALIIWVARDVINRTNSIFFQIIMIGLNIFLPILGLIIYLIIRPSKTLVEKYYEEIEYRALAEGALYSLSHCPKCGVEVEKDFMFCPSCSHQLRKKCSKCRGLFEIRYKICPYCGTKNSKAKTDDDNDDKKNKKSKS